MEKARLRKIYKEKRQTLSAEDYSSFNVGINQLLIEFFSVHRVNCIHLFLPIRKNKEIDLKQFWLWCWSQNIKTVVPVTDFRTNNLKTALFSSDTVLLEQNMGIPEPTEPVFIDANEIGAVIVPLLAFDSKGYRVGYGGGFYDRFFEKLTKDVTKVGVSFFSPIDEVLDKNEFDIPVNICVTPSEKFEF